MLFEILTGRVPHEGKDTAEVLRHIAEGPPPRAREVDPAVPAPLDAVCARAMARRRGDRYARATELAQDVQRFLADEPVSVYREGWAQRAGRWTRRHWTATMACAAALAGPVTYIYVYPPVEEVVPPYVPVSPPGGPVIPDGPFV